MLVETIAAAWGNLGDCQRHDVSHAVLLLCWKHSTSEDSDSQCLWRELQQPYVVFVTANPKVRDTFIGFRQFSRFYTVFGTATPNLRDTFIDFLWKSRFYTVFGSATPEIRDTFIDFRRKSRFYSMLSTAPPQIRDTFINFLWESRFYTVFGAATPNLRDTFIDFLWKSRFYDVNKIRTHQKARVLRVFLLQFVECIAFFRVFRRESWNVSRFCLLFIGFLPFSKGILCKSMIVRSPAFLRLGLERPGLQKSSISFEFLLKIDDFRRRVDSEKPGVEKSSIFIRNPFGIFKSIQRDFNGVRL